MDDGSSENRREKPRFSLSGVLPPENTRGVD